MNTLILLLVFAVAGLAVCVATIITLRKEVAERGRLAIQLAKAQQRAKAEQAQAHQREQEEQARQHEDAISKWKTYAEGFSKEAARLAPFAGVADAAAEAQAIVADAVRIRADASNEVARAVEQAKAVALEEAAEIRRKARAQAQKAEQSLSAATRKAADIIAAADTKATAIGGSAYEALKNAYLYQEALSAIKNTIEGYGDRYLIPAHSLLDTLAEDFSHTKAGQELKAARARSELMIENGTAAKCDNPDARRRQAGVRFVIDAFNGRADSILSRVKSDNAGTLEQELADAFTMVNYNGKAFMESQVNEEYLAARMEELRWAVITQQLKLEEREEQRRIKEQIREEEKAKRDYEKAIREAQRDEDMLRKAMEKAQQQITNATTEQKAKYELLLKELEERLKQAEEKNQRAISMAQQTKQGHVYIISNVGSFGENVYKIGLTRRLEPLDRVRELGDSSVPFAFDVHALIFSENAPALETQLHRHFVLTQVNKVNYRKEFFRTDLAHIRSETEKLGLLARWTMTAAAVEHRESLAIEKAITEDPAKREAWLRRQLEMDPLDASAEDLSEDADGNGKAVECLRSTSQAVGTGSRLASPTTEEEEAPA